MGRATGGIPFERERLFKPSLTYKVLHDPYALWCDYHAPKEEAVDETTRYDKLRMEWGSEYEAQWVRKHHPQAVEIRPRWGIEALKSTLKAMLEGAPAIYQPQLWALDRELYGLGDVLVRDDSAPSDLGGFHYRVQEIKRSRSVQDYHVIQAVFYNRIVTALQGYAPLDVEIVLPHGIEPRPASGYEKACDGVLDQWRQVRDGKVTAEPPGYDEAGSPWRVWTNKVLEERGDLTLVPVISSSARKKFREVLGISRAGDLDALTQEDFQRALGPRAGLYCFLKLQAHRSGRPVLGPSASLEIPRRKRHFYFDFETCDNVHPRVPAHVYMIGAYDLEEGVYRAFVTHGAEEEAAIFRDFMGWVGDLEDACLYHWTPYEIGQIRRVAERHPELLSELSRLIGACVDLKASIAKKLFFGTRSYSIKEVAPFLGFNWRQGKEVGAYESMVLYWEWVEDQDPTKIEKVTKYNEDDCMAMVHVDRVLGRLFGTSFPFDGKA